MLLNPNDVFAGRYVLQEMLGKGGFSVVWKATDNMAGDVVVAIKIYAPDKGLDNQGIKQFSREYSLVLDLHHTRLLTARHFDVFENSPYLVIPFCSNGSLGHLISEKENLSEKEIALVILQVCEGLAYLHSNGIIHQDIKPDNVLINSKGEYLLTDFGISSKVRNTLTKSTGSSLSLTLAYSAPERFAAVPAIIPAGDMFALGIMIYEMATGDVPWMGQGGMAVQQNVTLPELVAPYSKGLTQWMQSLMMKDPSVRPDAKKAGEAAQEYLNKGQWPTVSSNSVVAETPVKKVYKGRETSRMEDIPLMKEGMSNLTPLAKEPAVEVTSGSKTLVYGQQYTKVSNKKTPVKLIAGLVLVLAGAMAIYFWLSNNSFNKEETQLPHDSIIVSSNTRDIVPMDSSTKIQKEENPSGIELYLPELITIEAGEFIMGDKELAETADDNSDAIIEHKVYVDRIRIAKHITTVKAYNVYCKAVGIPIPDYYDKQASYATNISWYHADGYCKWLSKMTGETWTLPTEAEWEHAAKTNKHFVWRQYNYMLDWCSDWYDSSYYHHSPYKNPKGAAHGDKKVYKGYWLSDRGKVDPSYDEVNMGFRVVKR